MSQDLHKLSRPAYSLKLANGKSWSIAAGDDLASDIVHCLGKAMQLGPANGTGRRLQVVSKSSDVLKHVGDDLVCQLSDIRSFDSLYIHLMKVSLAVVRQIQKEGGVLVHGALAEYRNRGIILAAPGGTGKTTASYRLSFPWKSLCDDTTLIVRDSRDHYWAHAWPTWSRFLDEKQGGTWATQQPIPLHAIFFLVQATEERVEAVGSGKAAGLLIQAVEQVSWSMSKGLEKNQVRDLKLERFNNICKIAGSIPVYLLYMSKNGSFWKEMEQVLDG